MHLVIDTNVFVISLTSRSPYHKIYTALINQQYSIAVSNDILLEYFEIIEKKYSTRVAHEFVNLLAELPNVKFINIFYNWHLISADKEDNKFVDCAIASSADYIVTEDHHFNALRQISFPKINIIGIESFMNKLKQV